MLRREQLDRQLLHVTEKLPQRPRGGWVRTIREALGMSQRAFAKRMGLSAKSAIVQLERAEEKETLTVKRLRKAADALNCDIAILLIPRKSLQEMVEDQAKLKAKDLTDRVLHTMALEEQEAIDARLIERTAQETQKKLEAGNSLWD